MKVSSLFFFALLLLISCNSGRTDFRIQSSVLNNPEIITTYTKLWIDKIDNRTCIDELIDQTEKNFTAFTATSFSSSPVAQKTVFNTYNVPISGRFADHTMLPLVLNFYKLKISDTLQFENVLQLNKNDEKIYELKMILSFYKIAYKSHATWFLGKIDKDEFFQKEKGTSTAEVTYSYTIDKSDTTICSSFHTTTFTEIDDEKGKQTKPLAVLVKDMKIDAMNNLVGTKDFTLSHLHLEQDSVLKRNGITVLYSKLKPVNN